jgi:predicted double-glycine peptidase
MGCFRFAAFILFGLSAPIAALTASSAEAGHSARGVEPVRSLLEMRRDKVVVQEWDLSCGAAALATLLAYQHGDPVPEREITEGMIRREEYLAEPSRVQKLGGFSLLDLKGYVDRRGYEGVGYGQLTFKDLIDFAPLIVPLSLNGYDHFVVFRGIWGDRVLLADPAWGNRVVSVESFEDAWLDFPEFGKVGFMVQRRDGAEPPNQLAPEPADFLIPPGPLVRAGSR